MLDSFGSWLSKDPVGPLGQFARGFAVSAAVIVIVAFGLVAWVPFVVLGFLGQVAWDGLRTGFEA